MREAKYCTSRCAYPYVNSCRHFQILWVVSHMKVLAQSSSKHPSAILCQPEASRCAVRTGAHSPEAQLLDILSSHIASTYHLAIIIFTNSS